MGVNMIIGSCIGSHVIGSNVNQIPAASLASVWLDGTIVDVSGSKYFVDKKGGANVLITGYDFPAGWVKGFPYKSAATIDIFGLTGVPVVSLFQNLDYGNQYFTRHVAQVVDGNGVETSEAYVADMVAYSEALAGDDLTEAITYYGVPAEIVTAVRWDDFVSGLDTSPTGSKLAPWKTLTKANASATAGDLIYCKTSDFDENSAALPGSLYLTKILNYLGIGKSEVQSTGASYVIYIASGDVSFKGIIVNAEDAKNICVNVYNVGNKLTRWERCIFKGGNSTIYNGQAVETVGFKSCVLIGKSASAAQTFTTWADYVDNCFVKDVAVSIQRDSVAKNNKYAQNNKAYCFRLNNISLEAFGNYLNYSGEGIIDYAAYTSAKNVNIFKNIFNQGDSAIARITAIHLAGTVVAKIYNDIFTSNVGNYTATQMSFVSLENCPTPEIYNNILISQSTKAFTHIGILVTTVDVVSKINYNFSKSNSLSGSQISLGYEGSSNNRTNSSEFIGNRVIGFKQDFPAEAVATVHAVLLNCGINMLIKYNHISHTTLGLVVKTGTQMAYTANGVQYNLISECNRHIWVRGVSGLNIFNNTLIQTAATYGQALSSMIYADENSANAGTQDSENIIIKNNLLVSMAATGYLLGFDTHAGTTGLVCDYNIYYSPAAKPFLIGATEYSFAEWQALGHDAHSIFLSSEAAAKALFTNFDAGDYTLKSGANQAVGSGVELAGYTAGLDAATTWGSVSAIPVITTKENTALCIGAYVQ